jgi:DNA-binding NtrC family response regulator
MQMIPVSNKIERSAVVRASAKEVWAKAFATPEAMALLKKYDWPGNIRELENVIEHAFILESTNSLTLGSLPETVLESAGVNIIDSRPALGPLATSSFANTANTANMTSDADIEDQDMDSDLESDDEEMIPTSELGVMADGSLDFNAQKEAFEKEFWGGGRASVVAKETPALPRF